MELCAALQNYVNVLVEHFVIIFDLRSRVLEKRNEIMFIKIYAIILISFVDFEDSFTSDSDIFLRFVCDRRKFFGFFSASSYA